MCSRLAVASLAALMLASIARAQVTLNVIPRAANRYCHPRDRGDTAGRAAGDDAQGGRKGDSGLALPIPAIAGIAVGVILLAVFAATAWWYRRAVPASKAKQSAPSP